MTEILAEKRIKMLEEAREEHTLNYVWSQDFFLAASQTNYGEKKCAVSIVILLRSFLLGLAFFTS